MSGKDLSKEAVAASLVLAIVLSGIMTYIAYDSSGPPQREPDTLPLAGELSSLTTGLLLDMTDLPDPEIEREISRSLPDIATLSIVGVEGYSASLFDVEVSIGRYDMPTSVSDPPPAILLPDGSYGPNSMLYGRSGGRAVIPVLRAHVTSGMRLDPVGRGDRIFTNISFTTEIVDTNRAVLALMSIVEDEMDEGGSLARDVEYMLNTLARVRAVNRLGWQNRQSHFNVLNEGDVELALNIALALRLSSLTGQVPGSLISSIEAYYTRTPPSLMMNPTGFRYWSESERTNYELYSQMAGPASGRRSASGLFDVALQRGHVDPADLLARYLYLDRLFITSDANTPATPRFDMFDTKGALEESMLVNARHYQDLRDASSMRTVVSLPKDEGLNVLSIDANGTLPFEPDIDLNTDYLVSARDFRIEGIDSVRAWYTEVDLDRTPESLVNTTFNFPLTRAEDPETRCGGIVPPEKPPAHDYRMEWNLRIEGSVPLRGSAKGYLGSVPTDEGIEHLVNFSFPVRVTSWFDTPPSNDNIPWFMIYKTVNLSTEFASGYIIPPEANATEFFEQYAFQSFRGAFAPITALGRVLHRAGTDPEDTWTRAEVQIAAMQTLRGLERWRSTLTTEQMLYMINLMNIYLQRGALIPLLEPIHTDNLVLTLSYTQFNDRLDISASSPGYISVLSVYGLMSPPIDYKAYVMTDSGSRIDLDLGAGTFVVIWDSGTEQIREGSGRPAQPTEALLDLALRGSWEVESPSVDILHAGSGGFPFESYPSMGGGVSSISFVSRGIGGSDRDAIEDRMMERIEDGSFISISEVLSTLLSLSGEGHWTGLTSRWEGEGGGVLTRTLWVSGPKEALVDLSRDPWMMQMIVSTIWGVDPGARNDRPPGPDVALETAYPSASFTGEGEVVLYQHLISSNPGRTPSIHSFSREDGSHPSSDQWRNREVSPTSPLW